METQVEIAIAKIKEIEFSIQPSASFNPKEGLGVALAIANVHDLRKEELDFQITMDFKNKASNQVVVHIKVSNIFFISAMKKFLTKEGNLDLPEDVMITMLSLSISHTRALLAKGTSGTIYEAQYFPIINPKEVARQVFNTNS